MEDTGIRTHGEFKRIISDSEKCRMRHQSLFSPSKDYNKKNVLIILILDFCYFFSNSQNFSKFEKFFKNKYILQKLRAPTPIVRSRIGRNCCGEFVYFVYVRRLICVFDESFTHSV